MIELAIKAAYDPGSLTLDLSSLGADDTARVRDLCETCTARHGGYVMVRMSAPHRPRTTGDHSQSHHLNGHIAQICAETGNDFDAVKYTVKMMAVEFFGYPFETVAGHVCPKKESDSDSAECALLIEAAHLLAAELGIILRETQ